MWGRRISSVLALVWILPVLAGGCGTEVAPPQARLDAHRWLGEPVVVANLAVWPVHTDQSLDVGEFLTLEEAEQRGTAAVREVGAEPTEGSVEQLADHAQQEIEVVLGNDEAIPQQIGQVLAGGGAVVNTLVIENQGDLPILVCAGTIVKGGQQDRQIGQDFVIAAKSTVPVGAFCVEQGRWHYQQGVGGAGSGFTNQEQGMAIKSVRSSAQYENDQSKVWAEVSKALKAQEIEGTTTFVAANEEIDDKTLAQRAAMEKRVIDHFARLAQGASAPVGFAYAVDGKPVTVRAFAHERLLRGHLPAFVKAMCLEADLAERARGAGDLPAEAKAADVVALVESLKNTAEREEETAAGNWNTYRTSDSGFNGECRLRLQKTGADKVIVTEDWTAR